MLRTIAEANFGPRGGLHKIKFKCPCQTNDNFKCIQSLTDLFSVEEYDCTICLKPLVENRTDIKARDRGSYRMRHMNDDGNYKVGEHVTYKCKNDALHDDIIKKHSCIECNMFIQDPDDRIKKDAKCICIKCHKISIDPLKCDDCDDYIWEDHEYEKGVHFNCHRSKTKPDDAELGSFEYSWKDLKWISKWSDGSWKSRLIEFGKYKGSTLGKVCNNKGYCKWLKNEINFKDKILTKSMSALYYALYYT